jgi:hypothetical protein
MPEQHVLCVILSQLDRALGRRVSAREDMTQLRASVAQDFSDQEPAMALVWLSAAAQQRDALLRCATQKPIDRVAEGGFHRHPVVQRVAIGVELIFTPGTPAERRAQVRVANATLLYRGLQLIAVEVGRVTRTRMGPYVHQLRDLVALHQSEEHPNLVV